MGSSGGFTDVQKAVLKRAVSQIYTSPDEKSHHPFTSSENGEVGQDGGVDIKEINI